MATPEQGVQIYRQILQAGSFPRIRGRFLEWDYLDRGDKTEPLTDPNGSDELVGAPIRGQMEVANPYLTSWNARDRQRVPAVWRGFIEEVWASKQPLEQLEGLFLRAANSRSDEAYEKDFRALLAFIETHRQVIAGAGLEDGLLRDVSNLVESKWKGSLPAHSLQDAQGAVGAV